ncbi:MAG: glycogen synthase, partial [Treponema sp.]|nr:glycogen synthase [Treponema sp.]
MRILMVCSEAVPFAKAGGLADMVSSLSISLAKLGHEVKIVIPRYYSVDRNKLDQLEGALGVPVGGGEEWCGVCTTLLPGSTKENPVDVYLIDHENYFGRDGLYGATSDSDFIDNPRRFTFFCRAAFQLCRKLGWYPDVLHAHDWMAALVPVYLKYAERGVPGSPGDFDNTVSVLTIHNLGYQGIYSKDNFPYTGLGWDVFYKACFEDWSMMNFLKAGLCSADRLNTVSPNYAKETKTGEHGFRLDGVLCSRSADYSGILNGIDTEIWNPRNDRHIPKPYSADDMSGKAMAKAALQRHFGLPEDPTVPLIGMVTRLVEQKGVWELFGGGYGSAWAICTQMKLQFVLLGSGDASCENEVQSLSAKLPNFKAQVGYNEGLSHLIYAGSDFFLMPSQYEPCGLNQMYSLVYGTLPIVRRTGGLIDTVENYNQEKGAGNGFMFDDLTPQAIYNTVGWANWTWYNNPECIDAMRRRAMKLDFSWE